MVFEQTVILNKESFKALSAESRIGILSNLKERRRTLSELSVKLSLGNSTVKEHCQILMDAGLIRMIDEGRKWKYYELTQKGKQVVSPDLMQDAKVFVMLCFGALIFAGFIYFIIQAMGSVGGISYSATDSAPMLSNGQKIVSAEETTFANTPSLVERSSTQNTLISFETLMQVAAICMVLGIGIGWFARTKTPKY